VPSEQITEVSEFGGTTIVVLRSGAGGLLLLMQPDSINAATTTRIEVCTIVTLPQAGPAEVLCLHAPSDVDDEKNQKNRAEDAATDVHATLH
jgi:hypothetical protein